MLTLELRSQLRRWKQQSDGGHRDELITTAGVFLRLYSLSYYPLDCCEKIKIRDVSVGAGILQSLLCWIEASKNRRLTGSILPPVMKTAAMIV